MSESAQKLEVVGEVSTADAPAGTPESEAGESSDGGFRTVPIVLAVLLGGALFLLFVQHQRGHALQQEVSALEGQLADANVSLDAHRAHLGLVRDQMGGVQAAVTDLQARLAELDAVVATSPQAPR